MKFIIALFALAAVACAAVDVVPIVRSSADIDVDGSFSYGYETGDGTSHDATGNADGVQGKYAYTSPEGVKIELSYVADANGFQPQGSHLPVAPEIPAYILRSIEWNKAHPEEDEEHH